MREIPSSIHIYTEGISSCIDIRLLTRYLKKKTRIRVDLRGHPIPGAVTKQDSLAREFAIARVTDVNREAMNSDPLPIEVEYELHHLDGKKPFGLLYDGFYLQEIFARLIPKDEYNFAHAHIIFTSRLFGTLEDNRYHARVAVFGTPTLISTTGLIEAPAKPREFYLRKQLGEDIISLKEKFKGRFIDYDDKRITEVMKGYVMQAFFYHAFGNPFCNDPQCRLYNAHWQEEVIKAQLDNKSEFCEFHYNTLARLSLK